ncbi:MAG: DUF2834 domain-containing protein [Mycobacterium sp.]
MKTSRRILCGVYATIAAVALIATWSQNVAYLHNPSGFPNSFLHDLKVNAAARSITVGIVLFFLAAAIFMVLEARRHGVPFVWAYIVGGMLIAISVTFPLFLIARERKLANADTVRPKPIDVMMLTAFAALAAAGVLFNVLAEPSPTG